MGRHDQDEQQLVLFQVSGEDYGIDICEVQRLIEVPEITRVPRAPDFVAGVIDVRGDIIPVINLKKRFGFENTDIGENGRIVIVEIGDQIVGFLVDGVSEVTRLAGEDIEPPGEVVEGTDSDFIAGIGKQLKDGKHRLIVVLDPSRILTREDLQTIHAGAPEALAA
jgi:purine-binding chemotaxis protein CheW